MIYFRDGTDAFPILTLNLEMRIYVHFYYCLEMRVDIHYCVPAECTSFLSMLGCSILYPGPIHAARCRRVDVEFQGFPGRIEFQ